MSLNKEMIRRSIDIECKKCGAIYGYTTHVKSNTEHWNEVLYQYDNHDCALCESDRVPMLVTDELTKRVVHDLIADTLLDIIKGNGVYDIRDPDRASDLAIARRLPRDSRQWWERAKAVLADAKPGELKQFKPHFRQVKVITSSQQPLNAWIAAID